MKKLKYSLLAGAAFLFASAAHAGHNFIDPSNDNFNCRIVGVMDGDTVDCLKDGTQTVRIRLASIDAPEKGQAYGSRARKHLSNLIFGENVMASIESTDRYGRAIGELFIPDKLGELSVNYVMVQDGMAWSYDKYTKDRAYITAQQQAKSALKGLWADKNPQNPEDFRKAKRSN